MIPWLNPVQVALLVLTLLGVLPARPPRDVIKPWLACIDCPDGQLDSVKARYLRSGPVVAETLLQHAIHGPVASDSAWVWQALQRTLRRDSTWLVRNPHFGAVPVQPRVAAYFRAYRNTWRARATIALAVVRDPRACIAADSISLPADTVSPMLRAAARMARDSLTGC